MNLKQKILQHLRDEIQTGTADHLPPTKELCRRHGIGVSSMRAILDILRTEGVISFRRGSGISVVSGRVQDSTSRESAAQRLYRHLCEGIECGRYRLGEPLPKREYLTTSMHVSPRTVTNAYNRLIAENRAHRVGKRVLAGGAIQNLPGTGSGVVIILTLRIHTWASICSQKRTADFGTVFQRMADQHGVRIIQAGIEKNPTDPTGLYPHGPYELGRLLHRLGDRYLGTILAVTRTELPEIQEWIDLLSIHRRPIVWFDRHDEGTEGLRTNGHVYRCRYSEEIVVRRALEYLAGLGHKKVGYAKVRDNEPEWSRRRYRLLRELSEAEPDFPEIRSYEFLLSGEWWIEKTNAADRLNELYMINRLPHLREAFDLFRINSRKIVEDLGHLVDEQLPYESDFDGLILFSRLYLTHKLDAGASSPHLFRAAGVIWPAFQLLPVLEDTATTALILPNDAHASPYVRWFRRVGVQIPQDLTLLSFDNEKYRVPVTSVDFGFGYLGHQAFLAVLGQNSVRCDKHGTIDPVATVVEKGSF